MKTFLSLVITLISSCYIVYGSAVLVSKDIPMFVLAYGVVALVYGMFAFSTLIGISMSVKPVRTRFMNSAGIVFLVIFAAALLKIGMLAGHELWGMAMAGVPFVINAMAMQKLKNIKWRS